MKTTLHPGCKVNVYLRITGRREDGMHVMESLFYPLPRPADTIHVELSPQPGITVSCSQPYLRGEHNILAKAYRLYAEAAGGAVPGVAVHLEKHIPVGAGLGGGSSDAAAFLVWLEGQAQALGPQGLHAVAVRVGADVPFFLCGRPAWVSGIGDQVTPVDFSLDGYIQVVVSPRVRVNTAWAYGRWDACAESLLTEMVPPTKESVFARPPLFWNDFEPVVFARFPILGRIKEALMEAGAEACVMSGSGSNFFAIFSSRHASAAARRVVGQWRVGWHEMGP